MKKCPPLSSGYRRYWTTPGATLDVLPVSEIEPPHEVRFPERLRNIVTAMRRTGWRGRPLLVAPTRGGRFQAFTGSHRYAAAKQLDLCVPVLVLEPELVARIRGEGLWRGRRRRFSPIDLRWAILSGYRSTGGPPDPYHRLAYIASLGGC